MLSPSSPVRLCLILFLHQTTTARRVLRSGLLLCLILFLHQTTTRFGRCRMRTRLCLILFLHQTTTSTALWILRCGCVLFYFYIKPQPTLTCKNTIKVVSYSISTSNHNLFRYHTQNILLCLILFLHQTTTPAILCGYLQEVTSF